MNEKAIENINVESTKALTDWSERSPSISKLASALCKAQANIEAAKKDADNPFFKSKYADLASVWEAIRKPFAENELSILQEPSTNGGRVIVTTTLVHSSGEYVRSSLELPVTKQDPQGFGSAITYGRRYGLQSITGVAPEDDDGNAASGGSKNGYTPKAPQPTAALVTADKLPPRPKLQLKKPRKTEYLVKYRLPMNDTEFPSSQWVKALEMQGFKRGTKANEWLGCFEFSELANHQITDIDTDDIPDSFKGEEAQQ